MHVELGWLEPNAERSGEDAVAAFLLYRNDVVPEDEVLDAKSLLKVKMPIGDA